MRRRDPLDQAIAEAVTLICAALTAFAAVASLHSCAASKKAHTATETAVTETTAADRQQAWQRLTELALEWEADSATLDFGSFPAANADTASEDGTAVARPARLTLYNPKAKVAARDSVTATAAESLTQASTAQTSTESVTVTTTRALDWWGAVAGIAIAILAWPLIQKLIKRFRNGL